MYGNQSYTLTHYHAHCIIFICVKNINQQSYAMPKVTLIIKKSFMTYWLKLCLPNNNHSTLCLLSLVGRLQDDYEKSLVNKKFLHNN